MRLVPLACLLALLPSLLFAADPPASIGPMFDDNGAPLTIAQFVENYIPADMPEGLGRKEVQAALEDAGANWVELAEPFTELTYQSEDQQQDRGAFLAAQSLAWLIVNAPHLDRLEIPQVLLRDSWEYAAGMAAQRSGLDPNSQDFESYLSSELFHRYLLNYRFDDEPVSNWAYAFQSDLWTSKEGDTQILGIQDVVERATANFTIIDKGYFGNLSDPVSLLHSRAGTKRELSILVAAALRSQGYATRFVRENRSGESWVEVYTGDPKAYDALAWTPVYPTAPDKTGDVGYATELCGGRICVVTAGDAFGREQVTGRYTQTGSVEPQFWRKDVLEPDERKQDKDFSGWAITAWNDETGAYVPLDDLEYPSSDKDYPLDEAADNTPKTYDLGPGTYRLECGERYPGGTSYVQTREFTVDSGQPVSLGVTLDPPADLPQAALVERDLGDFTDSARLTHSGRYVFLVHDGGEPSLRELDALKGLESMNSVYFQHWRMAGATEEERAFVKDVLKVDEEKDKLPVVIVVVGGKTTMYVQGYNLNVKEWVDRALEGTK